MSDDDEDEMSVDEGFEDLRLGMGQHRKKSNMKMRSPTSRPK